MKTISHQAAVSSNTGHAIVIGGSMSGMLAARVLSQHFARVTIIERDSLPQVAEARKGLPQARHLHALLLRGLEILNQLFPGIRQELMDAGASEIDTAGDMAWFTTTGWGVRFESEFVALSFTRDLLDAVVRKRLRAHDNIHILEQCDVTELLTNGDRSVVTGVRARSRAQGSEALSEQTLLADLVVDASGRNSRASDWLEQLGYGRPDETVVNAHLGYATRIFKRTADPERTFRGAYVQAAPPERTRATIMLPIEGDRWIVTLCGGDGDYPPTDEAGFMEFLRTLPASVHYDTLKDAEPLSPIYGYRSTENRRKHYEKMTRKPQSFVLIGDSICSFNPTYGQGMTTAAIGALVLDRCLHEQRRKLRDGSLAGLERSFHAELSKANFAPWSLATGEDCRYRGTVGGDRSKAALFMRWYVDHVLDLTTRSREVRRIWFSVFHMLEAPGALFKPAVLWRVLAAEARRHIPRRSTASLIGQPEHALSEMSKPSRV